LTQATLDKNMKTLTLLLVAVITVPAISKAQKNVKWASTEVFALYDTIPSFLRLSHSHKFIKKNISSKPSDVRYKFTDTCGGIKFIYYEGGKKVLKGFYKGDCKLYCDTVWAIDPLTNEEGNSQRIYYKPLPYGTWKKY